MLKELLFSIRAYFLAYRFIMEHKLWRWMIIPGILYALLFVVGMNYFGETSSTFIEWIILRTGLKTWLDSISSDWLGFFITMGSFWLWFTLLLFYFALFKYLFLILFSPFFSYLHLKVEAIHKGIPLLLDKAVFKNLIGRAVLLNLSNLLWQTVYLIPIVLVCSVPLIGWFTPLFTILMECYFLGFGMLDYGLVNEQKNIVVSREYIANHKGLAIGNGLLFYMLHLIPLIGWMLAPFSALISAHLNAHQIKEKIK